MRGQGGDLVLIEEADFIKQDVLYKAIFPTLKKTGTCCIIISTPVGRDGLCAQYLNLKMDNGSNFFLTAHIKTVCDDCLENGMESTCTHIYHPPHWQNKTKGKVLEKLYGTNKGDKERELMGIVSNDLGYAFPKTYIDNFIKQKYFYNPTDEYYTKYIFVGIDTHGISESSETSIISFFYDGSSPIICGIDSESYTASQAINNMIECHILNLRKLSIYKERHTNIILLPEIYAKNASYIGDIFSNNNIKDLFIALSKNEANNHVRGVPTNHKSKNGGVIILKTHLSKNAIKFIPTIVTSQYGTWEEQQKIKENKTKLFEELKSFREVRIDTVQTSKIFYSGKIDSTNKVKSGLKDDMVMAFVIGLYWSEQVVVNEIKLEKLF